MKNREQELEPIFERLTLNGLEIPLDQRVFGPDRDQDLVAEIAQQMERLEAAEFPPSLLGAISSAR